MSRRRQLPRWPRRIRRDVDATRLRHIGWRLAALMVGLLCALLLVIVAVVYLRTRAASLASLRDALRSRADGELYHLSALAPIDGHHDLLRESAQEQEGRGEIFIIFADSHLTVLGGSAGPFGMHLPDRMAALQALRTGRAAFSNRKLGGLDYLIYTRPGMDHGHPLGVVQTGLSERSYEDSLEALLQSLLLVCALGVVAAACITALVVYRALLPIRGALRHQRDFVADAAHELRAPLAILRTATELWLDPGSDDDQHEAVEQVLAQGAHLARLVDDLSLLARADSGAVNVAHDRIDLRRLVDDVVGGMDLLAEERDVRLCVSGTPLQVWGDASRLRQLLLILLDNSLKHTPPGGFVNIRITRHGHQAQLQVRDSGPGIELHDLPHLFDRFYRADKSRTGEGTGLGLAIAQWIVSAHKGSIRAANAPDGGALFTVTLPLAP